MNRKIVVLASLSLLAGLAASAWIAAPAQAKDPCQKFSGYVLMTYTQPDTIIFKVIRGKVSAATPFTMTSTTAYYRNGNPATFADTKALDKGYISAIEQLPSGVLLACTVDVAGP